MFRKSTYCGDTFGCVEVDVDCWCGEVHFRDSKDRSAGPLSFTRTEWDAFVRAVKDGQFDGVVS